MVEFASTLLLLVLMFLFAFHVQLRELGTRPTESMLKRAPGEPSLIGIGLMSVMITLLCSTAWFGLMFYANPVDAEIIPFLLFPPAVLLTLVYAAWGFWARWIKPSIPDRDRQQIALIGCSATGASFALFLGWFLWLAFHALGALAGAHGSGGPPQWQAAFVAILIPLLALVLTLVASAAIASRLRSAGPEAPVQRGLARESTPPILRCTVCGERYPSKYYFPEGLARPLVCKSCSPHRDSA